MVSYKLGIFNKKEGRAIDLDKILKTKELRLLDEFTSNFVDEAELKLYLFNKGLIDSSEKNYSIQVSYRNNGKVNKLPVLYSDVKKYRHIENLKYKLRVMSADVEFLYTLADYYDNGSTKFNKQKQNVADIRLYLSNVRSNGGETFESALLTNALDSLLVMEVFKPVNYNGEAIEDYRGLRKLIFLIDNYEKKKMKNKEESTEKWVQGTLYDMEIDSIPIKIDNEEVEDEFETNLSSAGDPDFPYNSEEEQMYQAYIEGLPDEYHPHKR